MSFSEYFSNYLSENEITIPELSKITGIARSSLYRYINGDRIPSSVETVEFLAKEMRMTALERQKFLLEYDKTMYGEDVVNSYIYIHSLIDDLRNTEEFLRPQKHMVMKSDAAFSFDEKTIHSLTTSHEIVSYAEKIISRCKEPEFSDKELKIIMQPTYTDIQQLLLSLSSEENTKITQIVCMEKTIEKSYINLALLKNILPTFFCVSGYNVLYHYESHGSYLSEASVLPNIMISDDCVLAFDHEMKHGFFTTDQTLLNYFSECFRRISSFCFPLMERGDYIDIIVRQQFAYFGNTVGTVFNQPCFSPFLDKTILEEHINDFPQKQDIISSLINIYGNWDGTIHLTETDRHTNIISFCTKNGLRNFAETGMVCEFPQMYYKPLTRNHIIQIFERMLTLINSDSYTYIIPKDDLILPSEVQIYWHPNDRTVVFSYILKNTVIQCATKETSIYSSLTNAIEYMKLKEMTMTNEEIRDFIKSLIEELTDD